MQSSSGSLLANASLKKWLPLGGLCVAAVLAGLIVPQFFSSAPAEKAPTKAEERSAAYIPLAADGLVSDPMMVPPIAAVGAPRRKRAALRRAARASRKTRAKKAVRKSAAKPAKKTATRRSRSAAKTTARKTSKKMARKARKGIR